MSVLLSEKSQQTPFICGLYYTAGRKSSPAIGEDGLINTVALDSEYKDLYASLSAIQFSQKSERTKAGDRYIQQLQFQFPNGDALMASRLIEILRTRYMIIKLTNGEFIIIGRNDSEQNTRPKITTQNNTRTTQVNFECISILPAGRFKDMSGYLLPSLVPLSTAS